VSEERPIVEPLIDVAPTALSAEALRGVIEAYVLREGTDYGAREIPFEQKVAQVLRRLQRGEARIVFDPRTRSVDILPVGHD
jgi:uncharacterized protein